MQKVISGSRSTINTWPSQRSTEADVSKQAIRADVAVMTSMMTSAGDQRRVERVRHVIQSPRSFGWCVRARGESDEADSSSVMYIEERRFRLRQR